jgi:1,2-diacylglycerol 3-alpha-glucosyltransferase
MRILFVTDTYFPHINGVYQFVRRLAAHLQDKGHHVSVMVPSKMAGLEKIDDINVYGIASLPVLLYPNVRVPMPLFLSERIRKILIAFDPDIIHVQSHFGLNRAVVGVAGKLGIPVVGTNHFMPENLTDFFRSPLLKKVVEKWMWSGFSKTYNRLKLVTAPTETAAGFIRDKLIVRVTAVSNGIDLEAYHPAGREEQIRKKYGLDDRPLLLSVGRLDPEKHVDEILKGVAIALEVVDFNFLIVGRGVRRASLEKQAAELGIADHIHFTGYVPDEDLSYLYKLGDCFITASTAELQSIATMEAMASGLPVIAVRAGALGELVHDGENGYQFERGDHPGMARSICRILGADTGRRLMGNFSMEIIRRHNIHRSVISYEEIYQRFRRRRAS